MKQPCAHVEQGDVHVEQGDVHVEPRIRELAPKRGLSSPHFKARSRRQAWCGPNKSAAYKIGATILAIAFTTMTLGCARPDDELLRAMPEGKGAVEIALSHGANVEARDGAGRTPLSIAAGMGDAQLVAVLLQRGAKVDEADHEELTPLHWAARGGHASAIVLLLDAKAKVDPAGGFRKRTPLRDAAASGSVDTVRALLSAGANPDKADTFEQTPMHALAVIDGARAAEIALALFARGAQSDLRDARGFTPAHAAAAADNVPLLRVLVARGGVSATTPAGATPLDTALAYKRDRAAEILLQGGAELRAGKRPPLHEAARTDAVERVAALLAIGADMTRDFDGKTPLDVAKENGAHRVEHLLERKAQKP